MNAKSDCNRRSKRHASLAGEGDGIKWHHWRYLDGVSEVVAERQCVSKWELGSSKWHGDVFIVAPALAGTEYVNNKEMSAGSRSVD